MTTSTITLDPTIAAPMANVAEYGFEGRFEDWAHDARFFEYTRAADPIGSGHVTRMPIAQFNADLYRDQPTGVVPLDLSKDLGITTGDAPNSGVTTKRAPGPEISGSPPGT